MVSPALARLAQLRARRRPDGGACSAAASRPSRSSPAAWPMRCRSSTCCRCVLKRYEDDGKPAGDRQIVALCAAERPLPLPGGAARHDRQLPRRAGALADARCRVPARRATTSRRRDWLGHKVRRAGARAGRGARPPDALHLRLERRQRSDRPARGDARQGGGRGGGREEARARGPRRHACGAITASTGSAMR